MSVSVCVCADLGTRQSALCSVVASSSNSEAMSLPCGTETSTKLILSAAWRFLLENSVSVSLWCRSRSQGGGEDHSHLALCNARYYSIIHADLLLQIFELHFYSILIRLFIMVLCFLHAHAHTHPDVHSFMKREVSRSLYRVLWPHSPEPFLLCLLRQTPCCAPRCRR